MERTPLSTTRRPCSSHKAALTASRSSWTSRIRNWWLLWIMIAGLSGSLVCVAAYEFGEEKHLDPELVEVDEWTDDEGPYKGQSNKQWLPESLDLDFNTRRGHVTLHLKRNIHMDTLFPVLLGKDKDITTWKTTTKQQNFAAYTDVENDAAIVVNVEDGTVASNFTHHYLGSFHYGEDDYIIEPAVPRLIERDYPELLEPLASRRRSKRDVIKGVIHDNKDVHLVRKVQKDNESLDETNEGDTPGFTGNEYGADAPWLSVYGEKVYYKVHKPTTQAQMYSMTSSTPPKYKYGIEMLMLVDFSIYSRAYNNTAAEEPSEKKEEAINHLKYYFTHIANGVDLRFNSIKDEDADIYVRLAGIYIATTPEAAPWIEQNQVNGTNFTCYSCVSAEMAIRDLRHWLVDHQNELPYYDQASLFTRDYMLAPDDRSLLGWAIINGICTEYGIALNKETGFYGTTLTTAHEIGHNLGALHDGDDNDCKAESQYIMAARPGNLSGPWYVNSYTFSDCSVGEFKSHLSWMNRKNVNCLLNRAEHKDKEEVEERLEKVLGQHYPPDVQCHWIFGNGSFYCGGATEDAEICRRMECYHPYYEYCTRVNKLRGAPGTTCGNKKWCELGVCVENEAAPEANDTCFFGDYKGQFHNNHTCDSIATSAKFYCYDERYSDDCCETCERIKDVSKPECPYGDKRKWCATQIDHSRDCYHNNNTCCETCVKYYAGIPGCEYGDRAEWCDTIKKRHCYLDGDVCCLSCLHMANFSDPDCMWGDQVSWCATIKPSYCYKRHGLCCHSCRQYETGIKGCEYGDHTTWCQKARPRDCYKHEEECCISCEQHKIDIPGCKYGNRRSSCKLEYCYLGDPQYITDCCETCYGVVYTTVAITTTTTTPTTTTSLTTTTSDPNRPEFCSRDSARWCSSSHSSVCYKSLRTCCYTCQFMYRSIKGCEFGDHYSWCKNKYCTHPDLKKKCCETCHYREEDELTPSTTPRTTSLTTTKTATTTTKPKTTTSDCVDGADWCRGMPARDCYVSNKTCCATCARFRRDTGVPDCDYGDKYSWCRTKYCSTPRLKEKCCQTCAKFQETTTSPTTTVKTTTTTTDSDCRDRKSWCDTIIDRECYDSHQVCCGRCSKIHTGIIGCEFGDRVGWCREELKRSSVKCEGASVFFLRDCCYSCKTLAAESTTSPPPITSTEGTIPTAAVQQPATVPPLATTTATPTTIATTTTTTTTTIPPTPTTTQSSLPPGCEMDAASWCQTMPARDCYVSDDTCCVSCYHLKTGPRGCEYGDRVSWCARHVTRVEDCDSPSMVRDCCLSCSRFKQQLRLAEPVFATMQPWPGCINGATWCSSLHASHCYHPKTRDLCCQRCVKHWRDSQGCEYGDRYTWCENIIHSHHCNDPEYTKKCCWSCMRLLP